MDLKMDESGVDVCRSQGSTFVICRKNEKILEESLMSSMRKKM